MNLRIDISTKKIVKCFHMLEGDMLSDGVALCCFQKERQNAYVVQDIKRYILRRVRDNAPYHGASRTPRPIVRRVGTPRPTDMAYRHLGGGGRGKRGSPGECGDGEGLATDGDVSHVHVCGIRRA